MENKKKRPVRDPRERRVVLLKRFALVVAIVLACAAVLFALYRNWAKEPPLPPPVRPSHQATSTDAPADSDREEGCYTFLVVGFDKVGVNTDTVMVVSFDVAGKRVSVMNIPRDTMVNVPWDIKRINSVYGESGVEGLREQVAGLIGFLPDYYITIDLEAFGKLVDEIGGVVFNVPINMYYDDPRQSLRIRQSKGERRLWGDDAMQVARFRINNDGTGYLMGDIDRIHTQQALMTAIAKQCLTIGNLTKIPAFMEIFNENVESDLNLGSMVWFGEQLLKVNTEADLHFFTLPGNYSAQAYSRTYKMMQSYVTPKEEELLALINEHFNPFKEPVDAGDLDLMSVLANGAISASSGNLADARANEVTAPKPKSTPQPAPAPSQPEPEPSQPDEEEEPNPEPATPPEAEPSPATAEPPESTPTAPASVGQAPQGILPAMPTPVRP